MRWKAEDELGWSSPEWVGADECIVVAARGRIKQLQDLCQEKRSQLQEVMADAEEERKQRQDLETQLQRATKEASIARRDLAKVGLILSRDRSYFVIRNKRPVHHKARKSGTLKQLCKTHCRAPGRKNGCDR